MNYRSYRWALGVPWVLLVGCGGADQCRTDSYPAAPADATSVLHVSAGCSSDGADGSASNPYPTISEALVRSKKGATVLIAPGTYDEQLQIKEDITLVGSSDPASYAEAAAVLATTGQYAVVVSGGEQVVLQGLHITDPEVGGIKVVNAAAKIMGSWIERAALGADGRGGYGVVVDRGSIILQNSAISSSRSIGVLVSNSRAIILQNQIDRNGDGGVRAQDADGEVEITGNKLIENELFGIGVFNSRAIILQNEIVNTRSREQQFGDGILVSGGVVEGSAGSAGVDAAENIVSGSARTGFLLNGQVRTIILQRNEVKDSGFGVAVGGGIWLQASAGGEPTNKIDQNKILGSKFAGVSMTGLTHGIILQNNEISSTKKGSTFIQVKLEEIGDGISLAKGASAHILQNKFNQNERFAMIFDSPSPRDMIVEGNEVNYLDQQGIILQNAGGFTPSDNNRYSGPGVGVASVPPGTYAIMDKELSTTAR